MQVAVVTVGRVTIDRIDPHGSLGAFGVAVGVGEGAGLDDSAGSGAQNAAVMRATVSRYRNPPSGGRYAAVFPGITSETPVRFPRMIAIAASATSSTVAMRPSGFIWASWVRAASSDAPVCFVILAIA